MTMKFDSHPWIAIGNQTHNALYLTRSGNTNSIRQANALNPSLNYGVKYGQQVDEIAAERVLSRKAYISALSTNMLDQWHSLRLDLINTPSMTIRTQLLRGAEK